jgi:hypothetical protein
MRLLHAPVVVLVALLLSLPAAAAGDAPAREQEPVVLTGAQLGDWAVPANQTARPPLLDVVDPGEDPHNHYADPTLDTAPLQPSGTATGRLLGYRWEAGGWRQIPFQVDEVFTRYLDNTASGFSLYSGEDQHTTYAFDREGFRWTDGQCVAQPASAVATDPVKGLDGNDELAFMARDAGAQAPAAAPLPAGVEAAKEVAVADPTVPGAPTRYVYVMRAAPGGPRPAFDATNGYVRYDRDPDADRFALSESTYSDYGNAKVGPYCDAQGTVIGTGRRRPLDTATVSTPRYRFRYDGRWLMTAIQIAAGDDWAYGPDLVDRFKARAFAQDPGSQTPCCGFEEEDTNWGGSSTLLGERVGPVRAIRETWGADSGTNVVRRETFYRDELRQRTWLRVHVIPPLDGIYAQWDFDAGRVTRFYNARNAGGVAIDGRNDEAFGNLDDPCNPNYDANDTSATDQGYRGVVQATGLCDVSPYHLSINPGDPSFADANAALGWSEVSGPGGTIVDRIAAAPDQATPRRPRAVRRGGALLPRRLVLRRRHGRRSRAQGRAALGRRAAHGRGRQPAALLASRGRPPRRQRPLLPGLDRHARPAPALPGRLRQRAPDGAGDRDRQRLEPRDAPRRAGQRRRALWALVRAPAGRHGQMTGPTSRVRTKFDTASRVAVTRTRSRRLRSAATGV